MKKIFQAFRNAEDAQKTYREIMLLRQLEGHDNLVSLQELYVSEAPLPGRDIYLVFPFMETDLYNVIRARILEEEHKNYILYQILRGLKWLHTAGVVHRDIRPSNLLLNRDCHVKICGLHSARRIRVDGVAESVVGADRAGLTNYVGHRWYRAPELLLGSEAYGTGVDIWSAGCILGELVAADGRPIFPGTSHYDQVNKILGTTGRPSKEDIKSLRSPLAADFIKDRDVTHPRAMTEIFPTAGPKSLDLLRMMLTFNADRRVDVMTALRHPLVLQFHNPEDEPSYEREMSFRFHREQRKERQAEEKAEKERADRLKRAHEKKLLHQKTEHHASAELEALMGVQEDDVQELELQYQVGRGGREGRGGGSSLVHHLVLSRSIPFPCSFLFHILAPVHIHIHIAGTATKTQGGEGTRGNHLERQSRQRAAPTFRLQETLRSRIQGSGAGLRQAHHGERSLGQEEAQAPASQV